MIPYTITMRPLNCVAKFQDVWVYANNRLEAQIEAHKVLRRPDYVVAAIRSHGDCALELAMWDRL